MNRTNFIKSGLALLGGLFVSSKSKAEINKSEHPPKFDFIHIDHLPEGIKAGDIIVIDNYTNKPIVFEAEKPSRWAIKEYENIHKEIRDYKIQYVDEKTGIVGGKFKVTVYDFNDDIQYWCEEVVFSEKRNIRIVINKQDIKFD